MLLRLHPYDYDVIQNNQLTELILVCVSIIDSGLLETFMESETGKEEFRDLMVARAQICNVIIAACKARIKGYCLHSLPNYVILLLLKSFYIIISTNEDHSSKIQKMSFE